jgi:chemotaxis family two-component system response regulator Rcp1
MKSIQAPASVWPSVSESWIGITGGSGSSPNPDEELPFASRSLSEEPDAGQYRQVLIIEDNEADVFLIEEALQATRLPLIVRVIQDGEQAVNFFDRIDGDETIPRPALVILDINLPKKQGGEVLKHIRESRRCAKALVIAVSTSDAQRDRDHMTELGANGYFWKPSAYADFMKLGDLIIAALGVASGPRQRPPRSL